MTLKKVRVQLLNEQTGDVIEEVDVVTSADAVTFADGETFQQKLNAGKLRGPQGNTGATGAQGIQGPQGPKGDKGDTGATGAKGSTGATGAKGVSVRLKGAWSSSTAYVNDSNYIDLVTANGNTYACKVSNTNQAVSNTTYWELVAQKGATGAKGDTGAQGPKGDKGNTGATGPQGPKGADGDGVKVGTSLGSATECKIFFKVVG